MRMPISYSAAVLAIAGLAVAGIWRPDWLANASDHVLRMGDWIMSVIVAAVALALLLCRWRGILRHWWRALTRKDGITAGGKGQVGEKDDARDSGRTQPASPYPAPDRKRITGFRFETDLCLVRLKERDPRFHAEQQYIVAKDYVVCVELGGTSNLSLKVPRGLPTDLASVPKPFRPFVGRVGPHLEASIVHDYLYVAWQIHGLEPTDDMRLFSDKVMLAAMLASGMGCKARAIYWAVRLFGSCIFYGRNRKPWILEEENMPQCCCRKSTEPETADANKT